MSRCRYCAMIIYWYTGNKINFPFEDPSYNTIHKCPKKPKVSADATAKNSDDIRILFRVIDSLIDRVSSLEQKL